MERLIYSSNPSIPSSKFINRKPSSSSATARIHAAKVAFPLALRSGSRRTPSLFCIHNEYSTSAPSSSSQTINCPTNGGPLLPDGSNPKQMLVVEGGPSIPRKAAAAGSIVVLSAAVIAAILIHPVIVRPAFATFESAAKSAAPAAVRTELLSSAWTGFFAGCLHTLSGPDHLAALAPLSIGRTRMESAAVGALWGCGHDAGQLIFGLVFLLLKDRLHIEIIRTWGTRVVGFTLLVIGAMGIKEALEAAAAPAPCVVLENGEYETTLETSPVGVKKKKKIGFATFATGIVHGLQPDALMMILPALALPSRLAGAAFLGMFLFGTVIAMGSYTVFIGSCSEALKDRVPRITEKLTWASSLVAIGLGVAIIISQLLGYSLY